MLGSALLVLSFTLAQCSAYNVVPATQPLEHAECPSWDPRSNLLLAVDIHQGNLISLDPETNVVRQIHLDGTVAPVVQTVDPNVLLVGLNHSVVSVEWDGISDNGTTKEYNLLATVSEQFPRSRTNDGKADVRGRFWLGTMGNEDSSGLDLDNGVLYRFDRDTVNNPVAILQPVNISNGMAWNRANDKLFYIDTLTGVVSKFDFDAEQGTISNRTTIFNVGASGHGGGPDGMTIDRDDNLWVALFDGWQVVNVNSETGEVIQDVDIPAARVTSVMWGGRNLDTLYVTTSRFGLSPDEIENQPLAGSIFAVTDLGTSGVPIYYADIL